MHKKWKPQAGLEWFSLDIGGKDVRLLMSLDSHLMLLTNLQFLHKRW